MENYRSGPHTRYDLKYHFVWVTKYRKGVLTGAVGERLRELVREVCRTHEIEILQGSVSRDHVHVLLSCPPNVSPSKVMQYLKGKSSRKLLMEFKHLQKQCKRAVMCTFPRVNGATMLFGHDTTTIDRSAVAGVDGTAAVQRDDHRRLL